MKAAMAESDKYEVMRDHATYLANFCDSADIKKTFESLKTLVLKTKKEIRLSNL
jgi:hypothetical protein